MTSPFALRKPSLEDVAAFLAAHDALLVHFSGTPKGGGSSFNAAFPFDLQAVMQGQAQGGLSASVVSPLDEFNNLTRANATGCVGLVLRLRSPESLVAVSPPDCGSVVEDGIRKVLHEKDIDAADLNLSISARGHNASHFYNEWVVRDFEVAGVFAMPPLRIMRWNAPWPDDTPSELKDAGPTGWTFGATSIAEISAAFPGLPLFTFREGKHHRHDQQS